MAFGAPASGGLFGSPFGATSTPGFGQTAPASPFGSTTPAFGAAPQSQPAFSFNQSTPAAGTSLFGAPASPSPFGATTTPAFGSTPSPGLFGANASPGAFGAASAPSLFGGTSAPAFGAATTGSWFGASSAAATTSAFGGSLFNNPGVSAPATTSLFGPSTTTAPATTSLWGAPQPGAAGGSPFGTLGTFGGAAPSAANTLAPSVDSALKEIQEIKAAYTPGNPQYRFQYLLLNVVDNPAARIKPPNIDEMRWRQALAAAGGADNADRLWPVPANGFKDLLARSTAQVGAMDENSTRLKALQDLAFRLAKRQGSELKQRASAIQRQHQELAARLLHAVRMLDALEARLAGHTGYRSDLARAKEDKLSRQLAVVEAELAPGAVTGLTRRLGAVSSAAQMAASNPGNGGSSLAKLDDRSSAALLSVLRDHADGVAKLQALLKRDLQDVAIMKHEMGGDEAGGGGRLMAMD